MTQTVAVTVFGTEEVVRTFEDTGRRAETLRPFWPALVQELKLIEQELFASDGATGEHGRWPELSHEWLARKWQEGKSLEILRASEDTHDALVGDTEESVRFETDDSLVFGASTEQFGYQQGAAYGTTDHVRHFVDITRAQEREIADAMQDYIMGNINRAGRRIGVGGRFAPGRSAFGRGG